MKKIGLWQGILTLLLIGLVFGCDAPSDPDDTLEKLTGEKLQTIKSPDSVVVKRIKTTFGVEGLGAAEESLSDFKPLAGKQLKELQSLLTDTDSYGWDYAKDCVFSPGILIVFSKGDVKSEVRICFECMIIGFTPGHLEDVDPVEQELIDWAKSVFPNDKIISSLKPH